MRIKVFLIVPSPFALDYEFESIPIEPSLSQMPMTTEFLSD